MKWPVETIDVVVQVNPKLAAADRPDLNEIVCFVPMAAVSEQTLSIEAQAERPFSEVAKGYTPFKRGDVLVAKITPCFENGKMALADNLAHELGFGTTEFHVFRPSERITGPYLFNLLRAPYVRKAGAMKMKGAAGQRRVPADFFAALTIPLPPLDEQKRIAGILDAADALRAKRREALAQLDTLLQSIFLDMFGDPVTNPMGWPVGALRSLGQVATGGTPPSAKEGMFDGTIPFITPGDLDERPVDQADCDRCRCPGEQNCWCWSNSRVLYRSHDWKDWQVDGAQCVQSANQCSRMGREYARRVRLCSYALLQADNNCVGVFDNTANP